MVVRAQPQGPIPAVVPEQLAVKGENLLFWEFKVTLLGSALLTKPGISFPDLCGLSCDLVLQTKHP